MRSDYVLDASALVLALVGKTDTSDALRERLRRMRGHAPHLIDAEVGNVLRRHELAGRISGSEAEAAMGASQVIIEHRYPHTGPLAALAWTWRANLSFYDALYVALAVRLGVPLVTADARMAGAPGLPCEFEVV
ncbi:MAG: type II toxin-antitoxin system VapC family toxin [Actinomycetes bacterium]